MNALLNLVIWMAIVTWLTLLASLLFRTRAWTPAGMMLAFGNRDNLPAPTALAGRVERTARNTIDNLLLFAAIALVAQSVGASSPRILEGAQIFFWARIVYIAVYYAGLVYLRTAVWAVSIVGLAMMISGLY